MSGRTSVEFKVESIPTPKNRLEVSLVAVSSPPRHRRSGTSRAEGPHRYRTRTHYRVLVRVPIYSAGGALAWTSRRDVELGPRKKSSPFRSNLIFSFGKASSARPTSPRYHRVRPRTSSYVLLRPPHAEKEEPRTERDFLRSVSQSWQPTRPPTRWRRACARSSSSSGRRHQRWVG